MPDYKALYFKMFRASEQAINLLIETQRACEEQCISDSEAEIQFLKLLTQKGQSTDEA